jgi:hypothetical protein
MNLPWVGSTHIYQIVFRLELSNHGWLLRETTVGFPLNVTSFTLTDLWGFTMPSLV